VRTAERRTRILRSVLAGIAAVGVAAAATAAASQPVTLHWTIDGIEREALVYPSSRENPSGKVPLVLAFHGHGGNARGAAKGFHFQDTWPEALVAYMQGIPTKTRIDPQGRLPGWQLAPGEAGDRDLKFVDAALQTLERKYSVDTRRVYATGFSNGGFFVYLLWAQRPQVFAAFAPCAAVILEGVTLKEPRPLLHIAGMQDPIVPFADQQATVAEARRLNQTAAQGKPCGLGCTIYTSPNRTPVISVVHPDGHIVPSGASAVIVKFFQAQTLP